MANCTEPLAGSQDEETFYIQTFYTVASDNITVGYINECTQELNDWVPPPSFPLLENSQHSIFISLTFFMMLIANDE